MAIQVPFLEVQGKKASKMKCVALLYHDVVSGDDWDSSGFSGPGTARYKLSRPDFEKHLLAIAKERASKPTVAMQIQQEARTSFPFLLTFDDGGESAYTCVAGLLESQGWKGHFFVTASRIGTKHFLNAAQIRDLRERGHIVGSHSFSHPKRMGHCSVEELTKEWTESVAILSDILGEPVDSASVPGGYYSKRVAETASAAGIRTLFNSEPTTHVHTVNDCFVVGRFNVFRGMQPGISADLVSGHSSARSKQWVFWNVKKTMKLLGGKYWIAARERLLRNG
jgi:peptidoglycan/xylan/chitin deacetylase (PgdA/CDA1 family)